LEDALGVAAEQGLDQFQGIAAFQPALINQLMGIVRTIQEIVENVGVSDKAPDKERTLTHRNHLLI